MSVIPVLNMYVNSVSLSRPDVLKSGIGTTAEILSFASPKESIQRKSNPDAACILRSSGLNGVFRRSLPDPAKTSGFLPLPYRAHFANSCDARGGITGGKPFARLKVVVDLDLEKMCRMLPTTGNLLIETGALHSVQHILRVTGCQ